MADYNGDTRVILQRMGQQDKILDRLEANQEKNYEQTQLRLRECEKQTALHEQGMKTICAKVESLDEDVKRVNLVSKIIGGITGGLAVLAAAIGLGK